jgi:hypothetical protein
LNPTTLEVKVGREDGVRPGDVDTKVQNEVAQRLTPAMEAKADDLVINVPNFAQQFELAMGPKRPHMGAEYFASAHAARPPQVDQVIEESTPQGTNEQERIAELPKVPTPLPIDLASGNSLVAPPTPPADLGQAQDPDALPAAPALPDTPEAQLANAMEKNWVTVETKVPMKDLADEWKRVFYDMRTRRPKNGLSATALQTYFMQIEVEREEQVGPDTWSNRVTLKPIEAVFAPPYPANGQPEQRERYRLWAEQHQVDVAEPAFFRVLKGDPWYIPSVGLPKDPNLAAAETQPFDPANPNIPPEQMTPEQKRAVYIYKQKIKEEQAKQEAQSRKAATDAARKSSGGSSGGSYPGAPRRLGGGYAPLPIELAAGQGMSDRNPQPAPRGRPQFGPGAVPAPVPPPSVGVPGRGGMPPAGIRVPPPPPAGIPGRVPAGVPVPPPTVPSVPNYDPANPTAGIGSGSVPTGPFDPTRLTPDPTTGKLADVAVWAHDDTVQPGKTYRYRMRVRLKNPLYGTWNLAKDPKLAEQFTIDSPWTDWKEVKAPRNTEFFFANARTQIKDDTVLSATVNVFKRIKGEWTMEQFTVAPGDSIGGVKNGVDYSTGATLEDLRRSVRGNDTRIMVSDEAGNIDRIDLNAQKDDPWYKTLLDKVRGPQPQPGAPGSPVIPTAGGYGGVPGAERGGI